jgi:hypothetical protein
MLTLEPFNLEQGLVKALSRATKGRVGAKHVATWKLQVMATKPSLTSIRREKRPGLERRDKCKTVCQRYIVDFPGFTLPNGSRVDGVATDLAWAPYHTDEHVLASDKFTPQCLIQKGHQVRQNTV